MIEGQDRPWMNRQINQLWSACAGYLALANDTTALALDQHRAVKLTVTDNRILTSAVPFAGVACFVMVLTSGTSSYTITFGTGFKSTGTLATGTSDAKIFILQFISDGTNLYESSRTAAMDA